MFILRSFNSAGGQENLCLNEDYVIYLRDTYQFDEIAKDFRLEDSEKHHMALVYSTPGGKSKTKFLHQEESYFIMTPGGETFDNLTYKGRKKVA